MSIDKPVGRVNFTSQDHDGHNLDKMPWREAESLAINKYWNGEAAPDTRHAVARMLWSEDALYLRFDCKQSEPVHLNENPKTDEKTMELWEHDVCELFLAPDASEPRRYPEFEISPAGEWLDLVVDWTKDEVRDWEYRSGMEAHARIAGELIVMAMKIPWTAFGKTPTDGDVWVGNLYRAVGTEPGRGYMAWSPTMTDTPQFHVPEMFGEFHFARKG